MNEQTLVKRIGEMHQKQGKLAAEEKKLTRQLTEGIFEEKDTDKVEGELARLSVRCSGLDLAIAHAERELESVRVENERKAKDSLEKQLIKDLADVQGELLEEAKRLIQLKEKNAERYKILERIRDQAHGAGFSDLMSKCAILKNAFPFGPVKAVEESLKTRKSFTKETNLDILETGKFTHYNLP